MRVYNAWSKADYIRDHIPEEFRTTAKVLTTAQIEALAEAIDAYYHRIRRQTEERGIMKQRVYIEDLYKNFIGNAQSEHDAKVLADELNEFFTTMHLHFVAKVGTEGQAGRAVGRSGSYHHE